MPRGYYHFCTDGWKDGKLFYTREHYSLGMCMIGAIALLYQIKIYAFVLMPNHIHILLSGKGNDCVNAFTYIKRRLSHRLYQDGFKALPSDYAFKLIPISDLRQMSANFLYILRNPYEKQFSLPTSYPWSSGWLCFSGMENIIEGELCRDISVAKKRRLFGTLCKVPDEWKVNPMLGLLPSCFVDRSMLNKLFDSPKQFETRLVKDYESFVQIARSFNENVEYSREELSNIAQILINDRFPGKRMEQLITEEKGEIAVKLQREYDLDSTIVARLMRLPEHIIRQFNTAKEYKSV